jgi:hypothetical protein
VGGVAAGDRYAVEGAYTVTAADVVAWAAGDEVPILGMDDPGATPAMRYVQATDAAGSIYSMADFDVRVAQVNTNNWALLLADTLGVLAVGDVIRSGMIA